ncbi:MAG: DUF3014 domain-containing protein [Thermoanaerobaculia bacterium]|nr:DUF3014 domain-containing protein [Thermoanaerobaculia bacterium]
MNRLDDYQLADDSQPQSFDTGLVKPPKRRPPWPWIGLVLVVVLAAGAAFWWFRSRPEPQPEAPVAAEPAPAAEPEEPQEPPLELPTLDASDAFLRQMVETLSSHPRLASWLATDNLIRRFTASVVNLSEGLSPRTHLEHMVPAEPFTVRRRDGEIVPTQKSFARDDTLTEVITALDSEGTVRTYRRLEPLFDEAFADLGYPGREFDKVLVDALDHLLATPVPPEPPRLVEDIDVYVYADPELENLTMAQRHLLRTGPENARRIQAKLAEIRRQLLATASS